MPAFFRRWMLSVCVLFVPAVVYGQASLTGVVRDTSGAVLPGVTVEAASPALIEKVRSVITLSSTALPSHNSARFRSQHPKNK